MVEPCVCAVQEAILLYWWFLFLFCVLGLVKRSRLLGMREETFIVFEAMNLIFQHIFIFLQKDEHAAFCVLPVQEPPAAN